MCVFVECLLYLKIKVHFKEIISNSSNVGAYNPHNDGSNLK